MFTVALIGADGAGKTTIARQLPLDCSLPSKYLFMGPNIEFSNIFNIHGLVGIRLVGASRKTITTFSARMDLALVIDSIQVPDIIVRFDTQIAKQPLTYLGSNAAAFAGNSFCLLEDVDGAVQARIPFEQIGTQCENHCFKQIMPPLLFAVIHRPDDFHNRFGKGHQKKNLPMKLLRKCLPSFKRQLPISKLPQELFSDQIGLLAVRPDKLFLIMNYSQSHIRIEPLEPTEFAGSIVQANEYEMRHFFEYYRAFRFAFPHLKNDLLEEAFSLQKTLLIEALVGKDVYLIQHPYGAAFETFFTQMEPFCVQSTAKRADSIDKSSRHLYFDQEVL